jgi:hypothetical protein
MNANNLPRAACGALFAGLLAVAWTGGVPGAAASSLHANVYLVQAAVPKNLTEKALLNFARSHANKILRETTDTELQKRKWKAEMVVAFNMPVNDMEFAILFYDIHDGPRRFVDDMSALLNDRKQKTFVQKLTLSRPQFKPNRNMELIVTVRRAEVGRLKFGVVGEETKRSGEVSFSDRER